MPDGIAELAAAATPVRLPSSPVAPPANPLSGLPDAALDGFVECVLFEDTGVIELGEADMSAPGTLDDPPSSA